MIDIDTAMLTPKIDHCIRNVAHPNCSCFNSSLRQVKPPPWRLRPPASVNPSVSIVILAFLAEGGSVRAADPELRGKELRTQFLWTTPPHPPPGPAPHPAALDGLAVLCPTWADWIDGSSPRHPNPAVHNKYRLPLSSLVTRLHKPAIFSESLAPSSAPPHDLLPDLSIKCVAGGSGHSTCCHIGQ